MSCGEERYIEAAGLLPSGLFSAAMELPIKERGVTEEFRLRCGRAFTALVSGVERTLTFGGKPVSVQPDDVLKLLSRASQMSAYSASESIREGYITVPGGFRIGLCGTAVIRGGQVTSLRDLTSASIRISCERRGTAREIEDKLIDGGRFLSTLIIAPPGAGKTTLLRDLIRVLSDGNEKRAPMRVAVADERGEIGAVWRGKPQMDIGAHTDIMTFCPKADGIMMLLRAMNPQIIAVDEVTAERDVEAMLAASNCGAALLASAHGSSLSEIRGRELYRRLLDAGIFERFVTINVRSGERRFEVRGMP